MDGLALIVVAAVMFVAGLFVGRQAAAKKLAARPPAAGQTDRLALAAAWQRGFDAATLEEARPPVADTGPLASAAPATALTAVGPAPAAAPGPPEVIGQPAGIQAGPPAGPALSSPVAAPARAVPPPAAVVPVDPRVRALRNINITLYVAALLMVAAASLFIALALPAAAKVVGLGVVAAGFYVVGLVMHARSERLRPAAAAFTATGLALVPMTGLAHYLLLSTTPGASWFATSLVGTAAFIFAAGRLRSKVVAGLATTFLVSTAYSGGAVLNRGLIFYFLFSMLLAAAITLVGLKRPRWISNIYLASFTVAHRYLVPATLAAAVFSAAVLDAVDYGWLFTAAALYYAVALAAGPRAERFGHQLAARAAALVAIACFLHVADVPATVLWRILAALLLAQVVLLARFTAAYRRTTGLGRGIVHSEAWILLVIAGACTMLGAEGLLSGIWPGGKSAGLDLNWALAVLLAVGVLAGARLGGNFRWVPLGAALLGAVEPSALNPGRQGIIVAAAALATWALARQAGGRERQALGWAARIASVVATGALFSLAASGWVLRPRFYRLPTEAPGASLLLERSVEVASWVGVVVAVLVQLALAARNLRRAGSAAQPGADTRFGLAGESVIFTGSVFLAAVAAWTVSGLLGRGSQGQSAEVQDLGLGWSAALWLGHPWGLALAWLLLGAGLLGATAVLGHRRPVPGGPGSTATAEANRPHLVVHAGGMLALASGLGLLAGRNPDWLVEIAALVGLAYAGIRILAATGMGAKIGYALLAQALFSGTAWHIADRFAMDAHGQYALFAFTVASAQGARAYLGRNSAARKPSDPRALVTLAAVAVLLLVPCAYLVSGPRGLDQAALLVQFLCLLALSSLVAATRARKDAGFAYVAIPAALGLLGVVLAPANGQALRPGGWLPEPLWNNDVAFAFLAVLLIGLLVAERRTAGGMAFRWVRAGVALPYAAALFGLHDGAEPGWQAAAGLLGAAALLVFSASRGIPLLLLGSAALVLLAALRGTEFIHVLAGQRGSEPLDTMLALGATCVVLLVAAIFGDRFGGDGVPFSAVLRRTAGWGPAHGRVLFSASLAALGIGGLIGLAADVDRYVYAGAAMLLAAVFAAAALEVPPIRRESGYEAAALVGAAVIQRCWWVAVGGTSTFAALYYWILVLGVLAAYEYTRKRERNGTLVLGTAAGVLSLVGFGTFLSSTLGQQLLVLLTFTALLVFGLVTNRRIFTVWGAIGVGVAVLWFLRGFTFLLLLLIAAGLIVLALWRLGRMNRATDSHGLPGHGQPPSGAEAPGDGQPHAPHLWAEGPTDGFAGPWPEPERQETGQGRPGQGLPGTEADRGQAPARPTGMPWMRPPADDGGGDRG